MFEKVNPGHPDKVADRIAGALVDLAYAKQENPKVAVEVLIGHGDCHIIIETSVNFDLQDEEYINQKILEIVGKPMLIDLYTVSQDNHLAENQEHGFRCGDNGIFKGTPTSAEETDLALTAKLIYDRYGTDGKYIQDGEKLIICQSNSDDWLRQSYPDAVINPLGDWTGGTDVDTGATNRKLGSDMGRAVTGGGLHGKDLSKADVSINIYAYLKAQRTGKDVEISCAIGDEEVDGRPYSEIVEIARQFIKAKGGFEKFAEWGLI